MNKHQKLLNKQVKMQKICHDNIFFDLEQTYRWHRCQLRMILKSCNEYDIDSLKRDNIESRENLIECGYI